MPSSSTQKLINADIDNLLSVILNNKQRSGTDENEAQFATLMRNLALAKDQTPAQRAEIFNTALQDLNTSFAQEPQLLETLTEIIRLTENKIYQRAPADEWVQHIGNYDLSKEAQAISVRQGASTEGVDAHQAVQSLLTTDESRALLYTNTFPEGEEQTNARDAFLKFLEGRHLSLPQETTKPRPTVDMKLFLGEEGLRLYKAAVDEEMRSRSFRDAVFLKSVQHYEGDKWDKKLVLWVGGPSASGKTYGASSAVTSMAEKMPSSGEDKSGNYVVSVDGGVEREVSQMRQMVLQVALAKGYKGIKDLHENTKLSVKEHVKAAALKEDGLSLVIPETFAESALLKRFDAAGAYKQNEMRSYHQDPRIIQAFSEVIAEQGNDQRFQTSVKHMGSSRAWFKEEDEFNDDAIRMNNRDIGCESKVYDSKGFIIGRYASEQAREILKAMDPNGYYIKIVNDLIFVKQDSKGNWQACGSDDTPGFKLSARDFDRWQFETTNGLHNQGLKEWFAEQRKSDNLAKANIVIVPNDIVKIAVESKDNPDVKALNISKRDYERFLADIHPEKPSFARVSGWCLEQAEAGKLITPLELIVQYKEDVHLRRVVSAPALLERTKQPEHTQEVPPPPRTHSTPIPIPIPKTEKNESSFKNHLTFSHDLQVSMERAKTQVHTEKQPPIQPEVEANTERVAKHNPKK